MEPMTWLIRRWWLIPFVFVVSAGSVATNLDREPQILLGVAAALSVVAVDWWLPAVVLNGVLVGTYFATGGDDGPIFVTIVVAAFLAATRSQVSRWLPLVVLSAVAVWGGLLLRGIRYDGLGVNLWQSLGIGALVAAAVAVATSARVRRDAMRDRLDRVASDEKLRMAQELHDGVGHGLAVIAVQAGAALHVLESDPARARASLEAIRATSREALDALRSELAQMAGSTAGAPRRPAPGLPELPALVERVRAAGLRVDLEAETAGVPERTGEVAHAVVQEALTNVLRHAQASRAVVSLRSGPDRLVVTVTDDGHGAAGAPGMGLAGMRARVDAAGGRLEAGPGQRGFRVRAELPVGEQDGAS